MGFSLTEFWQKLRGADVDALIRENEKLRKMVQTLSARVEELEAGSHQSGAPQTPKKEEPVGKVAPDLRAPSIQNGDVQTGAFQGSVEETMQLPKDVLAVPIVLVVEDNIINQRVARLQLEELGYRVHIVGNGNDAIEAAARLPYDVILMDCAMPVVDGYEATVRIRKQESLIGRRTPIIALTAHSLPGDREKCLACGMDDYLSKPASKDDLAKVVGRWVQKRGRVQMPTRRMTNPFDTNSPAP